MVLSFRLFALYFLHCSCIAFIFSSTPSAMPIVPFATVACRRSRIFTIFVRAASRSMISSKWPLLVTMVVAARAAAERRSKPNPTKTS
uniref:Putative secreted protein n=1 Tax=Anopheles darlingi TaxID=43151 RepID=A0A2M4DL80_ANODA